jgi:hypothetical protein
MLRELKYYSRMCLGLAEWMRFPIEADPFDRIRQSIANRETNFLQLIKRGVFENPANPYSELFRWAGCTYQDLALETQRNGLDATLERLRQSGVYLSHDEFKGKVPVRRGANELLVDVGDLANPAVRGVIEVSSSGSRSKGTVTKRSLEYQVHREAQDRMAWSQYEYDRRAVVTMGTILPGTGGLRRLINFHRWGAPPPDAWFDIGGSDSGPYLLVTKFLLAELRLLGCKVVLPRMLPHNDFRPVAEFIAARKREGRASLLTGGASKAVRVADAALTAGLDISGSLFITNGEALTDAKRAVIESAGCEAHARYTISELGPIGAGCRHMQGNCVHVFRDSVAVISRRRTAPLTEVEVESLLFTAVLPCAATILINVEMDDAGELGPAPCDCPLSRMGLTQQINNVFSYGKLTGHGTSLLAGDVTSILETSLPARFGGLPMDYQLVEMEGSGGQTEYQLRVHPRVAAPSREEVRDFFLGEIRRLWSGSLTARRWDHAEGVKVEFAEPYTGARGKTYALYLLGSQVRHDRRQ